MNQPHIEYQYDAYKPKMSPTWWLKSGRYFMFMMRELSSVFVAAFVLLFLYQLFLLTKGPEAYATFQNSLMTPKFLVFYAVAFLFSLYHTVTWLGVVGRVQVLRLGGFTVPPKMMTASTFVGFFVVSAAIGYFFL
ncbi:MAG: hypothetical protein QGH25_22575 [Candidatus Latescibacteria bacterium]|jgi:fumarate reductase subunit C|nr:hypothetical protein [Candidatus Latescibacterota bacterium]